MGADQTFTTPAVKVPPPSLTLGRPVASSAGVTIAAHCRAPAAGRCRATAVLTTLEHLLGRRIVALSASKRRHTRRVVISSASFSLSGGQTRRVRLALNQTGSRLLARFGRIPATLKVTLLGVNPPVVLESSTTITRKPKPKRKRHG